LENKEKILKTGSEKHPITNKGKSSRTAMDFSTETLKARRAWMRVGI
jgi:hypothetical protein